MWFDYADFVRHIVNKLWCEWEDAFYLFEHISKPIEQAKDYENAIIILDSILNENKLNKNSNEDCIWAIINDGIIK